MGTNYGYLVKDLKDEKGQKVSTLENVKIFIDTTYGVGFISENINLEEKTISINGPLLSTKDWQKIKENEGSNLNEPYNITLLVDGVKNKDDKSNRIKISMYEDGSVELMRTIDGTTTVLGSSKKAQ